MVLGKRARIALLVFALIAQCVIWAYVVISHWATRNEEVIYIPVALYDPSDYFRGAYLDLRVTVPAQGDEWSKWVVFELDDANHVVRMLYTNELPASNLLYAESFTLRRFYTSEPIAKEIEQRFRQGDVQMVVKVGVRRGHYSVFDLIIE